jgi:hypothetical protein
MKTLLHACRPKGKVFGSSPIAPSEKGRPAKVAVRTPSWGKPASASLLVGPCARAQWPGLLQVGLDQARCH